VVQSAVSGSVDGGRQRSNTGAAVIVVCSPTAAQSWVLSAQQQHLPVKHLWHRTDWSMIRTSHFYVFTAVRTVPEAFCIWVCPSVTESVHPENLVNTISPKPVKGISPNFGHWCIWVHRCAS